MPQMYDETFKKKMVRLRMEGRTINSIIQEYHISKSALTRWCEDYRKECQNNPEAQKDLDAMEEIWCCIIILDTSPSRIYKKIK